MHDVSATTILLSLFGAVALLMWGLRMVRTGLNRAYGADLRQFLGRAAGNRVAALLAGFGVTVLLQSSTATGLMTATFAGRRLMSTAAGLAILLGADIGTAVVAQVLSFDIHWLSPLLILIGVTAFLMGHSTRQHDLGRVGIGLGLMLLALSLIEANAESLGLSPTMQMVLESLQGEPILALLIAALLAALAHASLAVVLLVLSLAGKGAIPLEVAFVLVLGANIGGMLPPFLATSGLGPFARRVNVGHTVCKLAGCLAVLPFLSYVPAAMAFLGGDAAQQVVTFHLSLNIAIALVFVCLIGPTAAALVRFIPDTTQQVGPLPRHLDQSLVEEPSLALAAAARETLHMGDVVERMLAGAMEVFRTDDRKLLAQIERMDNDIDTLHGAIKMFLTELMRHGLSDEDSRRCVNMLAFTGNLEHIGDIVDQNLMQKAGKKIKNKLAFSREGFDEIAALHRRVLRNLNLALGVFVSGDVKVARELLAEKVAIRGMELAAAEGHLARLREGYRETMETTTLHMDIVRDLKRINSHLTSVAYPILEEAGVLLKSRLRDEREGASSLDSLPS